MTATIYLMTAEGWGEKKFVPRGRWTVDGQKEGKGLGREDSFPRPLPPTVSISKSNMAG